MPRNLNVLLGGNYLEVFDFLLLNSSGDVYWRFDDTKQRMDPGYPLPMSRWRGVPTHLDAAMRWIDGTPLLPLPTESHTRTNIHFNFCFRQNVLLQKQILLGLQ